MKSFSIDNLKTEGHELVDEIVDLGFDRWWVYIELSRRLGYPKNWGGHFSQMNTERELHLAIRLLKGIRARCKQIKLRKEGAYTKSIDLIRRVGAQNTISVAKQKEYRKTLSYKIKRVIHLFLVYLRIKK